jgi:hypothetical protein
MYESIKPSPHRFLRMVAHWRLHFEGGVSVFFSAEFLYEQREVQPNQIFCTDEPFTSGEL